MIHVESRHQYFHRFATGIAFIVSCLTTAGCTVLYYQESPIRQSDYQSLERTSLICIELQPFFEEVYDWKYPIVMTEWVGPGRPSPFGPHTKNITAMVPQIWGEAEILHPTRALAERFSLDLRHRFARQRFVIADRVQDVNRCQTTAEEDKLRFSIRTRIWDLRMVNGSAHLQYFARAQLSDLGQNRTVW